MGVRRTPPAWPADEANVVILPTARTTRAVAQALRVASMKRPVTMKNTPRDYVTRSEVGMPGGNPQTSTDAEKYRVWPAEARGRAIHLDSCVPFEHIAVRTRRNDYDVVVLAGRAGDVCVRGGRFFKEFRRARLAGSTFGGSAIRVRTIEVGCPLELQVDGRRIVTSAVEAVSRTDHNGDGLPKM